MLIYTDLKDKNKQRIFSNSILVVDGATSREIGNVYFSKGSFMWRTKFLSEVNTSSLVMLEQKSDSTMGWFDELDKYRLSKIPSNFSTVFPDDCNRIKDALKKIGKISSMEEAQDIWIRHSESCMAGWLYLPIDEIELEDILKRTLLTNK
jgi:hypothetical protein